MITVSLVLGIAAVCLLSSCGAKEKSSSASATTEKATAAATTTEKTATATSSAADKTPTATTEKTSQTQETKPVASGDDSRYLVWNLGKEPKSWDPTTNSESISDTMCKQLFEGLTVSTATGIIPGIATSWDVSEDGKTYTFHLRKNAKWSDGSPVTAYDFQYSWRRICDPAVASDALQAVTDYIVGAQEYFDGTGPYDDIKATALDDYTFQVVLKNVTPYFPQLVANDVYLPVKKDVVEANSDAWEKDPATCISDGPFKLTEYKIGSHFIFEKNPYYWDADSVKLKGIKAVIITDANTSLQGYQAGQIDVTSTLPAEQIPQLVAEDPNVVITADTGAQFLNFNCDKAPFNNVDARRAVAYAIDRKQLTEQVLKDGSVPASGFLAPTCMKTDGGSFRTMEDDGYPAAEYGIDPRKADVQAAKEELAKAGYPDGKGFPTVELVYKNNAKYKKISEAIQQMLKANLNINVTLRAEESSVFIDTKTKGKYDMAPGGWTNAPYDASGLVKLFYSQNGNNTPQWRWKNYKGAPWDTVLNPGNKPFDESFDKAMASQGSARDEAWHEAEVALMTDMPITPLFYPSFIAVVNKDKVEDVELTSTNSFMFKHAQIIK
jgi:oligopeptide transport system substrate-binding protein